MHDLLVALRDAQTACYTYDCNRKTIGSRILFFTVQILYHDYVMGKIR